MSDRKTHLRRNKLTGSNSPVSFCASRGIGGGKMVRNTRSSYQFMASAIVGWDDFMASDNQCMHCIDMGLAGINQQAREKGMPPFADWAAFRAYREANKAAKAAA